MADGEFLLPTGTVTLLLADVEGSTAGWEADPEAMAGAIVELNGLVDEQIGVHDGVRPVEQGEGDSFVAAFARARDAIACAVAIQCALAGGRLVVRMGLHTGDVLRRDEGNYVGPAVNRTARLRNLAHGGQTVLSAVTHDLVAETVPDGVTMRDMGTHRLRDLARPEHVFQLCHPDLPDSFPPLRSLDVLPHNLPALRSTFVGRATQIETIAAMLSDTALVTLTGAGGCGKTRLALQVAAETLDRYPDGVWLTELAPIAQPSAVPVAVAAALSLKAMPGLEMADVVVEYLRDKTALVVLDNCEHVLDGASDLSDALLARCPSIRILATSRQPLGVDGEVAWRVPSLSLPPEDGPAGIAAVKESEAVGLFSDRAQRARPGFEVTDDNSEAVAEICRRLDGIPLAIELAAARVRVLTPAEIASGLSERFRLLTGGARTAMPRQQTLEASVDWSHDLLTEPEQTVFRRLGVFAGGFDLDAAEQVCSGEGVAKHQVLDLLSLLIDKSLVQMDVGLRSSRYRLLETVRAYAQRHLTSASEDSAVLRRHRDHYLYVAEAAEPDLEGGGQAEAVDRLAADYADLRAALAFSLEQGEIESLARMAAALCLFWGTHGPVSDGERWTDVALGHADTLDAELLGRLQVARTFVAMAAIDLATTVTHAEEGLRLGVEAGNDRLMGRCQLFLGWAQTHLGLDPWPALENGLERARRTGDQAALADGLLMCGVATSFAEPDRARRYWEESVQVSLAAGNPLTANLSLANLGLLAVMSGALDEAERLLGDALDGSDLLLNGLAVTQALYGLGCVAVLRGRIADAVAFGSRLEAVARQTGTPIVSFAVPLVQGVAALHDGRPEEAIQFYRQALDQALLPIFRPDILASLVETEIILRDLEAAEAAIQELRASSESTGFRWGLAQAAVLRAQIERLRGRNDQSEESGHAALQMSMADSFRTVTVDALEALAGCAADADSWAEAARLMGAAGAIRRSSGYLRCVSERDNDLRAIEAAIGSEQFAVEHGAGAALDIGAAVAYAARGRGTRKRPTHGWASLSPTENEVTDLVRSGLTNGQIAERLFMSPRTVQTHLTHIFAKLSITSRTELAAKAAVHAHPQR
ncbi:MAG TPA: LuxR C-terminal-related transcriptional regulator [Acidimicrobiales bacterium]|nr:LuxR C-terminal-related transcriptional regulator [Acidimicrobiales bacterium]